MAEQKVTVEREFDRSGSRLRGEVLVTSWWYAPTYLRDDKGNDPTGEVSLFVRRYRLLRGPSGKLRVMMLHDVERFPDDAAMLAAIEKREMKELPEDQPPQDWYPPEVEPDVALCGSCGSPMLQREEGRIWWLCTGCSEDWFRVPLAEKLRDARS